MFYNFKMNNKNHRGKLGYEKILLHSHEKLKYPMLKWSILTCKNKTEVKTSSNHIAKLWEKITRKSTSFCFCKLSSGRYFTAWKAIYFFKFVFNKRWLFSKYQLMSIAYDQRHLKTLFVDCTGTRNRISHLPGKYELG